MSLRPVLVAILCILAPAAAEAQDAEVRGVVRDSSGGLVPGATVTAMRPATGIARTLVTDTAGQYVFSQLTPGTYEVIVALSGFETVRRPDLILDAGSALDVEITLPPAGVNEAIDVVAARAGIDDRVGAALVLDREFLANTAFDGRSLQSVVSLAPGVVSMGDGIISSDGSRTTSNYVTIDGVSANIGVSRGGGIPRRAGRRIGPTGDIDTNAGGANASLGGFSGGSDLIQLEALEQVRVDTSAYPAQYGRQSGAQVQLVSRSGTNQFTGSAFEYFRDSRLDANDWFSNANPRARQTAYRQQQFGGVFGGPIVRNRAFFFASYEGRRRDSSPAVVQRRVPAAELRSQPALSPELRRLLNAYPLPHEPEFVDAQGNPLGAAPFYDASPGYQQSNAYSIKIDRNFGSGLLLTGRWNQGLSDRTTFVLTQRSRNATHARTLTISGRSALSSRLLNELSVNTSRNAADNGSDLVDRYDTVPIDDRVLLPDFAPASSRVVVSLPGSVQDYTLGPAIANRQIQLNVVDNLSWIAGRHSLRFGVDFRRLTPLYGPTEYRSTVSFNTIDSLLNNTADQLLIGSSDQVQLSVIAFSAYAQDTFRMTSRLTFDYGVRWEVNPAPSGIDKPLYTLAGFPDIAALRLAPAGTPLYPTRWKELAPRVGATYRLRERGADTTIVRGSFGFYYDLGTGATATAARMFPYNRSVSRTNVPFPTDDRLGAAAPPLSLDPPYRGQDFTVVHPDNTLPRTRQWSAGIDHGFGAQRISVTYTGHAAYRLLRRYFYAFDFARPVNPAFPAARLNITRNDQGWGDSSTYHAMQVQYDRRLSRGVQALATYTLARATDSGSDDATVNLMDNATSPIYYDGYSRFDRRHTASISAMYIVPEPRAAPALLGGWSANVNIRIQSAPPLTVTYDYRDPVDTINYTYRVDLVPGEPIWVADGAAPGGRRLNPGAFRLPASAIGAGMRNQVNHGTEPRNGVRGFGTWQADLALQKQIGLGGRRSAQIRAEAYNVFNHPNFSQPDTSMGTVIGATGQFVPAAQFGRVTRSGGFGGAALGSVGSYGGPRTVQLALRLNF